MKKIREIIFLSLLIILLTSCGIQNNLDGLTEPTSENITALQDDTSQMVSTQELNNDYGTSEQQMSEEDNESSINEEIVDKNEEPENTLIELTENEQYEINIFLSNFAEQSVYDDEYVHKFDVENIDINSWVGFAHLYTKLNTTYKFSYLKDDNRQYTYYVGMTLDQFNIVTDRFFGITFTDDQIKEKYNDNDYGFYTDENFYEVAADGEAYNRFAVCDEMSKGNGNEYFAKFSVYELDIMEYWDSNGSVSKNYYYMDGETASHDDKLKKIAEGEAIVVPYEYKSRNSYRLKKYSVGGVNVQ